jgi:hypothetical protein
MPRPCSAASLAGSQMHGSQEIFCGIPGASECPYGQYSGLWTTMVQASDDHALSCKLQSMKASLT